ncbi:MAG: CDP-alcohol phosphatidyltransferase family protein [Gemmatimonadota bacterium]|nr:CDP-alcohol phosphatidyltransferase family protein [Gemmatimonadota bacterium]MDH3421624.1 CDP-alcohol phosphatidyltransferase family protein [Gemmatimonadota bacterium]
MAHLLTGLRLVVVVPSALAFARWAFDAPLWPAAFVALAIATDYFDGIVARARGTASSAGQLFDHSTDFLFVTGGLAGASSAGAIPLALPLLIVVAFTQYVLDSYILGRMKRLRMSKLGRWNGILYFVPLVVIALARLPVPSGVAESLSLLALFVSWLLVISTVASIIDRAVASIPKPAPPQG